MGFIDSFKTLRDMAAEYKNVELNKKILDLQSDMFELVEENQSLKQEIESLKKQISLGAKLSFLSPFWYMEGDSQPYCPKCKESDNKLIHLIGGDRKWDAEVYDCPNCDISYSFKENVWTCFVRH